MSQEHKESLFGKNLVDLQHVAAQMGFPGYTAKQMAQWLYANNILDIGQMTNLSLVARQKLQEHYTLGKTASVTVQTSVDGTKKYLFPAEGNKFIETAMIPDNDRKTVCVSSQVGCKMGCLFCMTGKQGFQGQLSVADILNQYCSIAEWSEITNIVYMGMGEPFDNLENVMKSLEILTSPWGYALSPRRITVSSIGLIPAMEHFLAHSQCHLAISLHTPFDDERRSLMPIQTIYPIASVIDRLKETEIDNQRRISFEYIMFKGVNDTASHVNELSRLLHGLKCRVNLIRFHPIPDTPLTGSDDATINRFKELLNNKGIITTIRSSRGQDIFAACGLLSTKELLKRQEDTLEI